MHSINSIVVIKSICNLWASIQNDRMTVLPKGKRNQNDLTTVFPEGKSKQHSLTL